MEELQQYWPKEGERIQISDAEVIKLFHKDISTVEQTLQKDLGDVLLSQPQFDALASLAYNAGQNIYSAGNSAHKVYLLIRQGQEHLVPAFIKQYKINKAAGLRNRRQREADLFELGTY